MEQLWLNGVTVVTAAGNDQYNQSNINYPPANDPFVITVGAFDGVGKYLPSSIELAPWSKRGVNADHVVKPRINAPGVDIVRIYPRIRQYLRKKILKLFIIKIISK